MAALETPPASIGWLAADFALQGTDGKTYSLADVKGPKGLVVMFICNHCPFVKSIIDRIVRDMRELKTLGIHSVAIMPNDTEAYPDDSFDKMQALARAMDFPFPYLIDPTQEVAKAYDAVCTPEFYGFDADIKLQYRGRLDASRREAVPDARRDLFEAMAQVARGGKVEGEQFSSMGCSIKWRVAA